MEKIKQIEKEAKRFFRESDGCHDWTHVERVRDLALTIGRKEKANLETLEVAALLHDIGREEEVKRNGAICHAEESGKMAREILKDLYPKEFIENVIHAIECHRFRKGLMPETLEAKILFDADKLDSIGAIGPARIFAFAGARKKGRLYNGKEQELIESGKDYSFTESDSALLEYYIKLRKVKDKLLTEEGKKIGADRHKFMVEYFERFEKEIAGEC